MLLALAFPLVLQAIAMAFDELVFHRKRGLGRWERIGHPLDTLTVLAGLAFLCLARPTKENVIFYICIATFSCLFITKDEPVHTKHCGPAENWLHAVLFVLHPVTFLALGIAWWLDERILIQGQLALTMLFLAYQIVYWNGPWRRAQIASGTERSS
jgi:hypothetical protein